MRWARPRNRPYLTTTGEKGTAIPDGQGQKNSCVSTNPNFAGLCYGQKRMRIWDCLLVPMVHLEGRWLHTIFLATGRRNNNCKPQLQMNNIAGKSTTGNTYLFNQRNRVNLWMKFAIVLTPSIHWNVGKQQYCMFFFSIHSLTDVKHTYTHTQYLCSHYKRKGENKYRD